MNEASYVGRVEKRVDGISTAMVQAMAATLDVKMPEAFLPPLWHWTLFQHWVPAHELANDGHPRRGGFLPAEPTLPRRMWAGGRLKFHQPLRLEESVKRTSTILRVEEKLGASGRLLFVTLQHIIEGREGIAVTEEQDIVYRGDQQAGAAAAAAPPVDNPVRRSVSIDTPLLFRYSALTGNAHRIHYDRDYARSVEGYPDLVVHGPLQATLLASFAVGLRTGRTMRSFIFRGRHPALFHRCPLILEGWSDGDAVRLRSLDADGAACTTAEAEFAA